MTATRIIKANRLETGGKLAKCESVASSKIPRSTGLPSNRTDDDYQNSNNNC